MRDLANNLGFVTSIDPAVQAATIKGTAVDLMAFGSAALAVQTGAIVGAGDFTAKMQESDTTTDGDFTDVVAADQVGSFPASLAASSVVKVGYVGNKRYVRPVITKNSGTSIAAGAIVVKGNADQRPVA